LDRRRGINRPPGYPFTLNLAVDKLLKKEFDHYRELRDRHPVMIKYDLDAIPAQHEELDEWRDNYKGIRFFHKPTNLVISGAVDDLWINSPGEYIVPDYKATSKEGRIIVLNEDWQAGYKRQMEIYQWLFRQNGFPVNDTGYFLYCNGQTDRDGLNGRLEFDLTLIPHQGDDSWVENTILEAHQCLNSDELPEPAKDCEYCAYRKAVREDEK